MESIIKWKKHLQLQSAEVIMEDENCQNPKVNGDIYDSINKLVCH